ncbi:MAG: 30S ribosomal protein S9 [Candidatus Eisenbacteria bacterium]
MKNLSQATGRRKEAVARVLIREGEGKRLVNGLSFKDYFQREAIIVHAEDPLKVYPSVDAVDVMIDVRGGGKHGQAGAVRLGIARALALLDPTLHKPLRDAGYLSRDPRMKERKKYGQPGARKRFQFSKR